MTCALGNGSHSGKSRSLPVGAEQPVLHTTGHKAVGWLVDKTFRPFKRFKKEPGNRSRRPHRAPPDAASPSSSPLPWQPRAAAGGDTHQSIQRVLTYSYLKQYTRRSHRCGLSIYLSTSADLYGASECQLRTRR